MTDEELFAALLRLADRLSLRARRVILQHWERLRLRLPAVALEAGEIRTVEDAALRIEINRALSRLWIAASAIIAARLTAALKVRIEAVIARRLAASYARQAAEQIAAQILADQAAGLAFVVRELTVAQVAPVASLVRQTLGLSVREADWVLKFRLEKLAEGLSIREAERLAARYAGNLLHFRAETLARSMMVRGTNAALVSAWRTMALRGAIDPEEWEREWVAIVGSERTCPICAPPDGLHGKRAPIGGTFPGGYSGGDAHYRCRCHQRLVRKDETAEPLGPLYESQRKRQTLRPAA